MTAYPRLSQTVATLNWTNDGPILAETAIVKRRLGRVASDSLAADDPFHESLVIDEVSFGRGRGPWIDQVILHGIDRVVFPPDTTVVRYRRHQESQPEYH